MKKIIIGVIFSIVVIVIVFQIKERKTSTKTETLSIYNIFFDKALLHSNLYPPRIPTFTEITSSQATVSWEFDKKKLVVKKGVAPEFAILSGFRIYRDGYWLTDVLKDKKQYVDSGLFPNEQYVYKVSALTFDNKIEGSSSATSVVTTLAGKPNTIVQTKTVTRYLAEGDSIAEGKTGVVGTGWVNQVAAYLKTVNPKVEIFNKAVANSTSGTVDGRIRQEIEEVHPDFITVAIGVNDLIGASRDIGNVSMSEYRDHLQAIIHTAKDAHASVMLLNITYIKCCYDKRGSWNKLVRDIANQEGVPMVDVSAAMENGGNDLLMVDALHPNQAGHNVIAKEVIKNLRLYYQ